MAQKPFFIYFFILIKLNTINVFVIARPPLFNKKRGGGVFFSVIVRILAPTLLKKMGVRGRGNLLIENIP
jgi:hypothetical protein